MYFREDIQMKICVDIIKPYMPTHNFASGDMCLLKLQKKLTLLHSKLPILHRVLAVLSAIGLNIHVVKT